MTNLVSVAYYVGWGIYARNFNVWNINPTSITHINYAFANIANGQIVLGDPYADVDKINNRHGDSSSDPSDHVHGNFHQLFRFKKQYRWIKTGISVGGWSWSGRFSDVAATEKSRRKFVTSVINFMLNYGFDYVDLDWEYPVNGGLPGNGRRPEDGTNFVLLLKEFKSQFSGYPDRKLEISCAISCASTHLVNYKLSEMDPYIDRYLMMCYDFTGAWSSKVDHHSNLFGRNPKVESAEKSIKYAISKGIDKKKIVVGMPMYGRGFERTDGLTRPFLGVGAGTWEPGMYDYKSLPIDRCVPLWEEASKASFCHDSRGKFLVSYDTPTSMSHKLKWILEMGLGGVMFWELTGDYQFGNENSLQRMTDIWLSRHLETSQNELCFPMSRHGNINKVIGCPSPSKDQQLPQQESFRPTLTKEHEDPFNNIKNLPFLKYARAHYNYSEYKQTSNHTDNL